jgi:hypothetical protein
LIEIDENFAGLRHDVQTFSRKGGADGCQPDTPAAWGNNTILYPDSVRG